MAQRTTTLAPVAADGDVADGLATASPFVRPVSVVLSLQAAAPAAAAAAALAVIWLVSGVGAWDIAVFTGYNVVFLALPGALLYRALAPRDGLVRTLAFGWALGHVIEMLAYLAAVSQGHRNLFVAYPLIPVGIALPLLLRRSPQASGQARERWVSDLRWSWAVAGTAVLVALWIALGVFPGTPLPGTVSSAAYLRDLLFQLSATAEVRNHWPLTDPKVAGVSVAYHTFPYMHMAGINQVAGIDLPVIVFRLAVLPLVMLFTLQLGIAARLFTRLRWVGPLAVLLYVFISEIDLDSTKDGLQGLMPFYGGGSFIGMELSPTYVVGLIFFVPAVVLLAEWLGLVEGGRWSHGKWALLGLFLAGCAGSKAMILPVLLGGLVVYTALRALLERRLDRRAVVAVAAVGSVFAFFFLTLYRGASVSETGAHFGIGGSTRWTYLLTLLTDIFGSVARVPGVVLSVIALLAAPLVGLLWFRRRGRSELTWRHAFLLSLLLSALGPFVLLEQPFGNDLFFISYGLVGASLVSAEGILRLWQATRAGPRERRVAAVYAVALLVALAVVWRLTHRLLGYGGWGLSARTATVQLSWLAFLAAVLAGLVYIARRSATVRPILLRLVVITALTATALNIPIDVVPELRARYAAGLPLHEQGDITPDFYRGLTWIRENTGVDDVVAVNIQRSRAYLPWGPGAEKAPDNFNISAFAERRVFYEGTLYTAEAFRLNVISVELGDVIPYPERKALNDAVFYSADGNALRRLARAYGVRYLIVDKLHAPQASKVPRLAVVGTAAVRVTRLVFSNRAIDVYLVRVPAAAP